MIEVHRKEHLSGQSQINSMFEFIGHVLDAIGVNIERSGLTNLMFKM